MKFENLDYPGGVYVEDDFGDTELASRNPNSKAMPESCHCHGGELTASCLNCKARTRARAKLAGSGNSPDSVYDAIDESGFCTSCKEVKPLRGARRALLNSDPLAEAERHITCENCLEIERADVE